MLLTKMVGLLLFGGAGLLFWSLLPKKGILNRWAAMPVMESVLPISVVGGFVVGLCLMILA